MGKSSILLDTNLIIRFLTRDNPQQARKVEVLYKKAGNNQLLLSDLVIAEVVYVLLAVYGKEKEDIVNIISTIIADKKFKTNERLMTKTLIFWEHNNISFVDAYLCAMNAGNKGDPLYSFDKRVLKIDGVNGKSP